MNVFAGNVWGGDFFNYYKDRKHPPEKIKIGIMEKRNELPYDIIFLMKRLDIVIEKEEYEKAHTINKWIKELIKFYNVEELYYLNFLNN
jgi:hypothetical protein